MEFGFKEVEDCRRNDPTHPAAVDGENGKPLPTSLWGFRSFMAIKVVLITEHDSVGIGDKVISIYYVL